MNNFYTSPLPFSPLILLGMLAASFAFGYLIRTLKRNKAQTRILKLEDEMLRNHAKILALEKNVSDLKRENNQLRSSRQESGRSGRLAV